MTGNKNRKKRRQLRRCITELVNSAREIVPTVEVRELPPYEDEDVVLEIRVPEGFEEQVEEALSERRFEMLMNEGVFISLQVIPDAELTAVERREK
ncbi:MAG: hypothetical protein N3B10_02575 [Armatimonadetes bacterium]|nr:hypothetical protein [Armatimonadota bacterium]